VYPEPAAQLPPVHALDPSKPDKLLPLSITDTSHHGMDGLPCSQSSQFECVGYLPEHLSVMCPG